jgi:predicted nuclease of predicted toxin-antitoxin system
LRSVDIEQLTAHLAKLAGEALKSVPQATAIDAIVMASAAQRGDVVYTSDFNDLERLRNHFPNVRVLRA